MKRFYVEVAFKTLEIYAVTAEDSDEAEVIWGEGELISTDDEAFEAEVLSVREVLA